MTGEESLYNLAEIAIALAGFSGLVAVFRSERLGSWLPRERFLFWLLLAGALGTLFLALFPITLHLLAGCGKTSSTGADLSICGGFCLQVERNGASGHLTLVRPSLTGVPFATEPQVGHSSGLIRTRL